MVSKLRMNNKFQGTDICSRDFLCESRGIYFVSISPIYFLIFRLHKWNIISVTDFDYRYILQMFLLILQNVVCFDSCVRLTGWQVYLLRRDKNSQYKTLVNSV